MCGIAGFTGVKNDLLLQDMNKAIQHRGPDDEGYFISNEISLANRRLAIVDIEKGQQPCYNSDKTIVVVFNGELYNHLELREELETLGHKFTSNRSDTELIPHLYERFGHKWLEKVNGMFAVAIYDIKKEILILAKDRIGKKPLYYTLLNNELYFASEIKSLLKIKKKWYVNHKSLLNYLQIKNTSAPESIFSEIKQLDYGQCLVWDLKNKKQQNLHQYWDLNYSNKRYDIELSELTDEFDKLFHSSLELRATCDVEYGTFLSGGLDSSLVSRLIRDKVGSKLKTFSLGYEDNFAGKQRDLLTARKYANELGTDHHELILNKSEVIQNLKQVMNSFNEPFSGTVSTFFLSSLIAKHVKVALSGDGADELFGSYLAHRIATPIEMLYQENISTDDPRWGIYRSGKQREWIENIASKNCIEWRRKLTVFSEEELTSLFGENISSEDLAYHKFTGHLVSHPLLNQSLELDQKELLHNHIFPFVDRLSMAHSLEVRMPFMDYRIIEFANSIHPNFKIYGENNKVFLKDFCRKYLPDYIIHRPKEGFVLPVYQWLETDMLLEVEELVMDCGMIHRFEFSKNFIELLFKSFKEEKKNHVQIWNLYSLAIWYDTHKEFIS